MAVISSENCYSTSFDWRISGRWIVYTGLGVLTAVPKSDNSPTLLFIHGGGYANGDKSSGDPNAGDLDYRALLAYRALSEGYNVVIDYMFYWAGRVYLNTMETVEVSLIRHLQ